MKEDIKKELLITQKKLKLIPNNFPVDKEDLDEIFKEEDMGKNIL